MRTSNSPRTRTESRRTVQGGREGDVNITSEQRAELSWESKHLRHAPVTGRSFEWSASVGNKSGTAEDDPLSLNEARVFIFL